MALAGKIAGKSPVANRLVKGMVYRGLGQSLEEHLPEAAHAEVLSLASEDHREALGRLPGRAGTGVQGPLIVPSPSGGGLGWGRGVIIQNAS